MNLQRILYSSFFLSVFQVLQAQTYQVFAVNENGERGQILRIESYENDHPVLIRHFGTQTQPTTTIQKKYTEKGLLEERKQTFHEETPYDLIRQYTYDENGQKIGELFGNNRTGKWGSFRYRYNAFGDVDTIFVFQKNGDLTDLRTVDYMYDEQERIIQETRKNIRLSTGKILSTTGITYEYPDRYTTKTAIKDEDNQPISTEVVRKTFFGAIAETTIDLPNVGNLRTVNTYDNRKLLIKQEDFESGSLIKTTTFKYDAERNLNSKKMVMADGSMSGERYQLLEQ
ncbi:MAG: hypothetical protein AAGJ18_24735 [Bacteroidota bacterium]